MSDQIFEEAYNRVRARFSDEAWYALSPRALTDAIYKEIREIDAERIARDSVSEAPVRSAFAA